MKFNFEGRPNETYEIAKELADNISEEVKRAILAHIKQYEHSEKEYLIAVMAVSILGQKYSQAMINIYGADEIIRICDAKLLKE